MFPTRCLTKAMIQCQHAVEQAKQKQPIIKIGLHYSTLSHHLTYVFYVPVLGTVPKFATLQIHQHIHSTWRQSQKPKFTMPITFSRVKEITKRLSLIRPSVQLQKFHGSGRWHRYHDLPILRVLWLRPRRRDVFTQCRFRRVYCADLELAWLKKFIEHFHLHHSSMAMKP